MNIVGTVVMIEHNKDIVKNGGGTYKGTSLIYKDDKGSAKEQNFHTNVLKYNAELKSALESLSSGEKFTMTKEKKGDFWNVVSIVKGAAASSAPASVANNVSSSVTTKGNWETPEERAQKQVFIIRQSSLANAVAFCAAKKTATVEEVIDVAKAFAAYVLDTSTPDEEDYNDGVE